MYKKLVLKFLAFDLSMGFMWILLGLWLLVMLIRNLDKARNRILVLLVSIGFILMGTVFFYSIRMRLFDYFKYLRTGDSYLKTKTCKVTDTRWNTLSFIIFGNEDIKCNDGNWYYIRYQRSYQRELRKGRIFKITFLPKSRVIITMHKKATF